MEHESQQFLESLRSGKGKEIPGKYLQQREIIYNKENSNFTKHWTHNMESLDLRNNKCSNFLKCKNVKKWQTSSHPR